MSLFIYGAVMKAVLGAEELRKKGIEVFLKREGKSIYRASNEIVLKYREFGEENLFPKSL